MLYPDLLHQKYNFQQQIKKQATEACESDQMSD